MNYSHNLNIILHDPKIYNYYFIETPIFQLFLKQFPRKAAIQTWPPSGEPIYSQALMPISPVSIFICASRIAARVYITIPTKTAAAISTATIDSITCFMFPSPFVSSKALYRCFFCSFKGISLPFPGFVRQVPGGISLEIVGNEKAERKKFLSAVFSVKPSAHGRTDSSALPYQSWPCTDSHPSHRSAPQEHDPASSCNNRTFP